MRKASCLICDNQFARQGKPWKDAGGRVLWPLVCSGCGAIFMDPAGPLAPEETENPQEERLLDTAWRAFRQSLAAEIREGAVLLITDPLHQRPQIPFDRAVLTTEMVWTRLESPASTLLQAPRHTPPLPPQPPVDWVVWWHGLEHTRRPAAHLSALLAVAQKGLWLSLPPWPWGGWRRLALMKRFLPQHRFLVGPRQMARLADTVGGALQGPYSPTAFGQPPKRTDTRWVYGLKKR